MFGLKRSFPYARRCQLADWSTSLIAQDDRDIHSIAAMRDVRHTLVETMTIDDSRIFWSCINCGHIVWHAFMGSTKQHGVYNLVRKDGALVKVRYFSYTDLESVFHISFMLEHV